MAVIVWFKRDLRVSDHPALTYGAARGDVLALYVVEPELWAQSDASGRQWAFVLESLRELHVALKRLGVPLCIRVGDAVAVLEDLRGRHGVTEVVAHEEIGNGWTYARDLRVGDWARRSGVRFVELPQTGVVRRLTSRDGWAGLRDGFMGQGVLPVPQGLRGVRAVSDPMPDLGLVDACPDRQRGGRTEGLALLDSFLAVRGEFYQRQMSTPLQGASACSRISPHLAWGTLSAREAEGAGAVRRQSAVGAWKGSLRAFESRLAWRDHFMQKLEDEPAIEYRAMHPAYEGLRGDDAGLRRAWERGETGLPFVDACMRSLAATGWLNFRMRSMVMAVASYHLWLDWRLTGAHLARQFTDYEPGIHWSQVQMQSGTTGINIPRIYNPIKQGRDQDPTGTFTRRWLPELAAVPDAHLQEPWRWEGAAKLAYPAPVVDVAQAARAARDRIWEIRRDAGHAPEAARVIQRHASRQDRSRRFVNDRNPRRRGDSRQMTLDL